MSFEKQIPILYFHSSQRENIKGIAYKNRWNIPDPIPFYKLREKTISNHRGLLIDDFDWFIKYILDNEEVEAISITNWNVDIKEVSFNRKRGVNKNASNENLL